MLHISCHIAMLVVVWQQTVANIMANTNRFILLMHVIHICVCGYPGNDGCGISMPVQSWMRSQHSVGDVLNSTHDYR